jgi:transposase
MRFDLTDKEWSIIEPLLPATRQGGERRDDRQVLNGIFYVLRTGAPWDDVPARYGPSGTIYNRFNRWAKQGIWNDIFEALQARCPSSLEMIDSTIVKAHRAAAGAEKGG